MRREHLDYYLDEFAFRFNRRRSKARGLLFHRLAEQAVAVPPAPYRTITGKPANLSVYPTAHLNQLLSQQQIAESDDRVDNQLKLFDYRWDTTDAI